MEELVLSPGQGRWASMCREGIPGAAVNPAELPGWPQSNSAPLVYPSALHTEQEPGEGSWKKCWEH